MAALTLRVLTRAGDTTKGAPLTNSEIDQNFINIDADLDLKAPIASPTFTGSVTIPGGTINATSIGATTRSTGAFTSLAANGAVTFTAGTASTTTGTGTLVVTGGVGVSGQVTASTFSGNGAAITAIDAANVTSGILPAARLSGSYTININGSATSATSATSAASATTATNLSGGSITTGTNTTSVGAAGGSNTQFMGSTVYGAVVSFHRSGAYAVNFGLDTDNVFRLGGWSDGTNVYRWSSDAAGNFVARGNVSAYSDIRLKTDLSKITNALDKIDQLTGYVYTRIDTNERQTGLIAQDVEKVLPEAVHHGDMLAVNYGQMMGLIVEAIKELRAEINALKK